MARNPGELIDLDAVASAFEPADGLPRPRWDVIQSWIDRHVAAARRESAWCEAGYQWLEKLCEHLGGRYFINSSANFALLTPQLKDEADKLLRLAEAARTKIRELLGAAEGAPATSKRFILVFEDVDIYYTYISHFYPDGEYGASAGVYLPDEYPHIALPRSTVGNLTIALTHELVHANLDSLEVPQWIEEGIAQVVEQIVMGRDWFRVDHERANRHQRYWQRHGLQSFWCGEAFSRRDEGQELSYDLAQILVRNLLSDAEGRFVEFLKLAERADYGEAAARQCFGEKLAQRARGFLGEGDWAPRPPNTRQIE
ncbi:MAG TPA: hypothetical protein VM243_15605 [Phycisphaerae bacterium]|nr:hypothetical protein [Phycisphaerae bacterium]